MKFLGLTLAWCLLNMGTLKGLKSICTYVQTPVLCSLVSSSKPNGTCGKSQMLTTYNSAYINVSDLNYSLQCASAVMTFAFDSVNKNVMTSSTTGSFTFQQVGTN